MTRPVAARGRHPRHRSPQARGSLLVLALGVAQLAGACTAGGRAASSDATLRPPAIAAAATGALPAYVAALTPRLQRIFADTLAPGAAVLIRSPDLGDWTATFGTRALGGAVSVSLADHVRIGSNTKTWTGTVILQLVQEGKLRLDDPVSTYRPDVPNGQNITIEQLLSMRSGLYNYSESLELSRTLDTSPSKVWSPEELLAIAYKNPPYFPPGRGFRYSNTNPVLLGLIVEQLTGLSAEQAFRAHIFGPLELANTALPSRESGALPIPYPRGYQFGTNVETMASEILPADQQAAALAGTLKPRDVTLDNPSWAWTAGSGISTAEDLARYAQALVGGGLLNDEMQRRRLGSIRPIEPDDPKSPGYGWALARFGPVYGHTGELPG